MNKQKCITSTRHTDESISKEMVSIIFLCDTPGYRMKSYGPMPLIPMQKNKLIDLQVSNIKKAFQNFEIILCVGYDADKVCKYVRGRFKNANLRIVENQNYHKSNSCEGVRLCLNNIVNDKIIIVDGSLLVHPDTLRSIHSKKSCIMTEQKFYENLEIGVNVGEEGIIEHFGFGAHRPWSEIVYLNNNDIIENLRRIISGINYKQKFLFEGLNELIKTKKHMIQVIENTHPIKKINNIKTYHKLREII
jgi:hypothetical protein